MHQLIRHQGDTKLWGGAKLASDATLPKRPPAFLSEEHDLATTSFSSPSDFLGSVPDPGVGSLPRPGHHLQPCLDHVHGGDQEGGGGPCDGPGQEHRGQTVVAGVVRQPSLGEDTRTGGMETLRCA